MAGYFLSLEFDGYTVDEPHEYQFPDLATAREYAAAAFGHAIETMKGDGGDRPKAITIHDARGELLQRITSPQAKHTHGQ